MSRNILYLLAGSIVCMLLITRPALAIDDNDETLRFLPDDAPVVLAVDVDEIKAYARSVGRSWREVDREHFKESLQSLSDIFAREEMVPDFMMFVNRLSGTQVFTIDGCGETPFVALNAGDEDDLHVIANYTVAFIMEQRLEDAIDEVGSLLSRYYSDSSDDYSTRYYPESIKELYEFYEIEEPPINPYTGEPVRFLEEDEEGSVGDVYYEPCHDYPGNQNHGRWVEDSSSEEDEDLYIYYTLKIWHINGVETSTHHSYRVDFEPYPNFRRQLLDMEEVFDLDAMGFQVEYSGDWSFVSHDDIDVVFAVGRTHLLFAEDLGLLMDAVHRYETRTGFSFEPARDFNTEGAFYRDQVDVNALLEQMEWMLIDEFPPDVSWMMEDVFDTIGLEAAGIQQTAGWLQKGDIRAIRRVTITGDAEDSLIGSILSADPEPLLSAEGGPIGIIGELAWANPEDFGRAYLDYIFDELLPLIIEGSGMGDMDPSMMLSMMGLGDVEDLEFGDQLYAWLTVSSDRGDGLYLPGLIIATRTDNEDYGLEMVSVIDTTTFMIPNCPFYMSDFDDENAATWLLDYEDIPISPTVAWTDGWVIHSLWREEALEMREAIETGYTIHPDGMPPANMRVHVHRQELLYGIADVLYAVPDPSANGVSCLFEFLAIVSEPDERFYFEVTGNDDYVEVRYAFSLDLFEKFLPVIVNAVHSVENY